MVFVNQLRRRRRPASCVYKIGKASGKINKKSRKSADGLVQSLRMKIFGVFVHAFPGRPSMDILVRSWQDLAKILEKS